MSIYTRNERERILSNELAQKAAAREGKLASSTYVPDPDATEDRAADYAAECNAEATLREILRETL